MGKRFLGFHGVEYGIACQSGSDFAIGHGIRHLDGYRSCRHGLDWDIRFQREGICSSFIKKLLSASKSSSNAGGRGHQAAVSAAVAAVVGSEEAAAVVSVVVWSAPVMLFLALV